MGWRGEFGKVEDTSGVPCFTMIKTRYRGIARVWFSPDESNLELFVHISIHKALMACIKQTYYLSIFAFFMAVNCAANLLPRRSCTHMCLKNLSVYFLWPQSCGDFCSVWHASDITHLITCKMQCTLQFCSYTSTWYLSQQQTEWHIVGTLTSHWHWKSVIHIYWRPCLLMLLISASTSKQNHIK